MFEYIITVDSQRIECFEVKTELLPREIEAYKQEFIKKHDISMCGVSIRKCTHANKPNHNKKELNHGT